MAGCDPAGVGGIGRPRRGLGYPGNSKRWGACGGRRRGRDGRRLPSGKLGSRTGSSSGLINAAPACTFRFLPTVEIGGAVQHDWSDAAPPTTLVGPSVKWLIHAPDRGRSVALLATAALDLRRGGVHSMGLVMPVTFVLGDRTRLALNGGWTRTGRRDSAFYGAQVEHKLSPTFGAMRDIYRLSGETEVQAGLCWTPTPGWFDVDRLAAHDGPSPVRFTVGLTLRR